VCVRIFQCLWRDQRGASLIDNAILAALITVLVVDRGGGLLDSWHVGALAAPAGRSLHAVQSSGVAVLKRDPQASGAQAGV
jgi:Flp pilus assembly pilin Flp